MEKVHVRLSRARRALKPKGRLHAVLLEGFHRNTAVAVAGVLDGPNGKSSQRVPISLADRKGQVDRFVPAPGVNQVVQLEAEHIVELQTQIRIKLNRYRDTHRTGRLRRKRVGSSDAS